MIDVLIDNFSFFNCTILQYIKHYYQRLLNLLRKHHRMYFQGKRTKTSMTLAESITVSKLSYKKATIYFITNSTSVLRIKNRTQQTFSLFKSVAIYTSQKIENMCALTICIRITLHHV